MRTFPTREALVAAYWRKLASAIGAPYKSRRVSARRAAHVLRKHRRHASASVFAPLQRAPEWPAVKRNN